MRLRRKLQGEKGVRTRCLEIESLYNRGSRNDTEEGREKEMERGRAQQTYTKMREMARAREKWTWGLHIDTIGKEIITRVSE